MSTTKPTLFSLEDHVCRSCGGRVLRQHTNVGMTPGGNPMYRCADCGKGGSGFGPDVLCWCGYAHRQQQKGAYQCLSFNAAKGNDALMQSLAACGCKPDRQEVGIALRDSVSAAIAKSQEGGGEA